MSSDLILNGVEERWREEIDCNISQSTPDILVVCTDAL